MSSKRSILIVDDDQNLIEAMSTKLRKAGFAVTAAPGGPHGVEAMFQQKFDVIFLDLMMPGRDGFSLLREREHSVNKDTPLLVLTSVASPEMLDKAKRLGATRCIIKAETTLQELVAILKEELKKVRVK